MKEQLTAALLHIAQGDIASVSVQVQTIKELPRTKDDLFDTAVVDADLYQAARYVYPVYAAYETECNKKEGYPDLLNQMRALDRKRRENDTLENTAAFLDALICTIDNVSPQLYEYYRELVDLFKENVNHAIRTYFVNDSFGPAGAEADTLIRRAIAHAGETYVLLAEKYEAYC